MKLNNKSKGRGEKEERRKTGFACGVSTQTTKDISRGETQRFIDNKLACNRCF